MMASPQLPPDTLFGDTSSRCPWCAQSVETATVTLEALLNAHEHGVLTFAPRNEDGTADASALTTECPNCQRPFMVAMKSWAEGRFLRLIAVRTQADVQWLAGRSES